MRLFFAIPIPAEAKALLLAARDALDLDPRAWRKTRPEALHLTLRFLGEVAPERRASIAAAGRAAAASAAPFACEASGLGTFPGRGRARIVWAGVIDRSGRAELARLASALEASLQRAGVPAEDRPLSPHVTLARARVPARPPALPTAPSALARWTVGSLHLLRSHLGAGGSRYELLESFPLAATL